MRQGPGTARPHEGRVLGTCLQHGLEPGEARALHATLTHLVAGLRNATADDRSADAEALVPGLG
ncbi:hypothetical protein [Mesorhizobium sp. WSM4310]|uniref:hypothetical protein n=1 Tax=Mesorhizobium sp. WSM4310 TaxID=2589883 RepID=UPI001FEEB175|nr:hypothetical protein [Mesorhizobium sp. WSM4310]